MTGVDADYNGSPLYYTNGQVLTQAIEGAGMPITIESGPTKLRRHHACNGNLRGRPIIITGQLACLDPWLPIPHWGANLLPPWLDLLLFVWLRAYAKT